MKETRQQTVNTYNRSAAQLAEYYRDIGPRVSDIELAFELAGNLENARVLEIGCAYGRDAKEIIKRSGWYLGIDISEEFVRIARERVPEGNFQVADITTFDFPDNLDIIFAFASLLHIDKDELRNVLGRAQNSLRPGGIFDISVKYLPEYTDRMEEDQYGQRQYYYYNPDLIIDLAGEDYTVRDLAITEKVGEQWVDIFLQKK